MRIQYYRVENEYDFFSRGIPRGVVVADAIDSDHVAIGYSMTNPVDHFTKVIGRKMATDRLESDPVVLTKDDILGKYPPEGSVFEKKRFRPLWDTVREAAASEFRFVARRGYAGG